MSIGQQLPVYDLASAAGSLADFQGHQGFDVLSWAKQLSAVVSFSDSKKE